MSTRTSRRSGCGLVLGLTLVVVGSLLLASNLFGFSMLSVWTRGLALFGRYWPVILVVWGATKIFQRFSRPEDSRVTAGEVFLLILLVLVGLSIRTTQLFMDEVPFGEIWPDIFPDPEYGTAQRFTEEQRFALPEGRGVRVENDRGVLTVEAWDEKDLKVILTKRVYRRSEEDAQRLAEDVALQFEPGGDAEPAKLGTRRAGGRSGERVETDLEIWVPRKTALTLANARGAVKVSGLRAAVGVSTAYDAVELEDVEGSVRVDGRHGPVRITNVRGDVEARNRYDTLKVEQVKGKLVAESANGELDVEDVSGTARLENRNSRIHAARVAGDLTVVAADTEVSVEDAGAAVSIETSFQSIFVNGARGRVSIEAQNSEIEVRDVKGDLDLQNKFRSVTVSGVAGAVTLDAQQCEVHLADVTGPIRVTGSYQPIEVTGFRGSLSITTQHAPLTLAAAALAGEIKAATTYGQVKLSLPSGSSFRLDAKTRKGHVSSEFEVGAWQRRATGEGETLTGAHGSGAFPITLETTFGDIEVEKLPPAEAEEEGKK